ncbi:DUF4949 domain-containing protein [Legionella sp. CNM-1927-20]|uniref:DUF4949 domain-containing protein n=1 Tax=Legionella sp. CNM-1927-20 TaxID=3422221 RepID=UPI00403A9AD7
MRFQKLVLTLPLLISQSVFALTADKPDACPTIKALSAVGVNSAEEFTKSGWITYRSSNSFETVNNWTLVVFFIEADNASEALVKANKALPRLSLMVGPSETGDNEWTCVYTNNDQSLMALAVTPPVDFGNWKTLVHKFNLKTNY